jgi:hypothetical protein
LKLFELKPPHGWATVAWDLAIVTLGVLIALVLQQWADERTEEHRTAQAIKAIRGEVAEHYRSAIEWRVVEPCVVNQIDSLTSRVLNSADRLNPAPIITEAEDFHFVLRSPSKEYPRSVWDAATGEGLVARLDPSLRNELAAYYSQVDELNSMSRLNDTDTLGMNELGQALPLDASTRYAIIHELQNARGRSEYRDTIAGQLIAHMEKVHMVPAIGEARALTERFGTYRYCKAHGLPMRTFEQAMQSIPNYALSA